MNTTELLNRIELNPEILVGKPVIKGTRLSVEYILGLLAQGATIKELIDEYNGLTEKDILSCFLFASEALKDNTFIPLSKQSVL